MLTLAKTLELHARIRPSADALIYGDVRLTWAMLWDRVTRTAAALAAEGIGEGSIIALAMKNSSTFIELLYAISHLGAISLPMNFRLSADELEYICSHAGADLVLADEDFRDKLGGILAPVRILDRQAQSDSTRIFGKAGRRFETAHRAEDDVFRLMYTSGTTDRPKGVVQSYANFHWKCYDHAIVLGLSTADRLLIVGPLYHVGACDLPGLGAHAFGAALIILREFSSELVLRTIETERITGIWLAPVMSASLLSEPHSSDTSTLRWCIGGGERTPEHRIRLFTETFVNARYVDCYGMTETLSGDTFMEPGRELEKLGSVGRPVPHLEIRIRDDDGADLSPGVHGEICMRGPKVTSGYWKDHAKTASAFFDDGFFRSGDFGYCDEDGFLYLTDRKKDMIISGGENIASSEVERVLYGLDGILEVAVVGREDDKWGEVPVAVVVLRPGAELTMAMIDSHCRKSLAGFKCPKALLILDNLPRNPSGKILKRVLREQVASLQS
ncbi:Acyl-CoA synthetase [Hyphomicrobiales bacterium]|nr:Acyl-CoA synthetase [Hyphomicrobiales bacterium]CAH1692123.1 Acyl-CoA synthetase [Hyphomicrobiales bacterium]